MAGSKVQLTAKEWVRNDINSNSGFAPPGADEMHMQQHTYLLTCHIARLWVRPSSVPLLATVRAD